MIDLDDYPVVTENSESFLNHRQLLDYRSEREECLQWLLTYGKEPDKAEGYAKGTVKPRSYRMDRFYRFVWKLESGYTVNLTHDHADEWMDHLARRDVSATDYDAIAVVVDDVYVSVRTALANDLFERALARDAIPRFTGYTVRDREPALPDHGRTDFLLKTPDGDSAYVEVKSCTHVTDGVAKFPDRQTERGRRHLRSLEALHDDGYETHVVFVIQRPDIERFRPYRAVDPDFADLLARVHDAGVGVHTVTTAFEPPHYWLRNDDLPVDLGARDGSPER